MFTPYNDTSGGGSGGGSNSNVSGLMMNVTEIFALLKKLTPLQREELSRRLQQSLKPDEILHLLQGGVSAPLMKACVNLVYDGYIPTISVDIGKCVCVCVRACVCV